MNSKASEAVSVLAAVITAVGSGSAAAGIPLGAIGVLAPQLGLAASVPVLVPVGVAVILGGVLVSKASKSRKQKGRDRKRDR